jgi:hypothetical protein
MKIVFIDRKLAKGVYNTVSNFTGDNEWNVVCGIFDMCSNLQPRCDSVARLTRLDLGTKVPIPREAIEYAITNFTDMVEEDIKELKSALND